MTSPHPDSKWTHNICGVCYQIEQPGRTPATITEKYREVETCCFCGVETREGIYYRKDPEVVHG